MMAILKRLISLKFLLMLLTCIRHKQYSKIRFILLVTVSTTTIYVLHLDLVFRVNENDIDRVIISIRMIIYHLMHTLKDINVYRGTCF